MVEKEQVPFLAGSESRAFLHPLGLKKGNQGSSQSGTRLGPLEQLLFKWGGDENPVVSGPLEQCFLHTAHKRVLGDQQQVFLGFLNARFLGLLGFPSLGWLGSVLYSP